MNGLPSVTALRRTIQHALADILSQRFFRDRLSVGLLVAAFGVNILNFVLLVFKVSPTDALVPVQFSSLTLFDRLGPWYFPYSIALFGAGVTVANTLFAYHSFGRSRLASFFLLITSVVVGIFCTIISLAFGAIR